MRTHKPHWKRVKEVLEEADGPLFARDIAYKLNLTASQAGGLCALLKRKGLVECHDTGDRRAWYYAAE